MIPQHIKVILMFISIIGYFLGLFSHILYEFYWNFRCEKPICPFLKPLGDILLVASTAIAVIALILIILIQ